MRGWLLECWCVCGAEIECVEQFAQEQFCCVACRRVLILVHECYEDGQCLEMPTEVPPGEVLGE